MAAKKINPKKLFLVTSLIFLALLTLVNFDSYLNTKKVLGVETVKAVEETDFWPEFLRNNPDYIPGWIETGEFEKARQIDPNYLLP